MASFRVNLFFLEFCTPFPKEEHVFEEFPVTIETTDYVYDGPNIRDDRARSVKLEVKQKRDRASLGGFIRSKQQV